jgi:hypothetical protein
MHMSRLLVFALCVCTAVPLAFAANPVTVNGGGGGDFLTIQDAITSWASGEANAGETAPFVINVVAAGGPYDEALCLDSTWASAEIVGDIIIQSSVPGTLVPVALQLGPAAVDDGLEIQQDTADVTLIDLLIYPSQTNVMDDEIIKIDGSSASAMNTVTIQDCIITETDAGGVPLTTTRAGAYIDPGAVTSVRANSFAYAIQHWADAGELVSTSLDNVVIYANAAVPGSNHCVRSAFEDDTETFSMNNVAITYGGGALWRHGSGGGAGTATLTGTDQGAGPDNCSFLYVPDGDSSCFWIYSCPAGTTIDLSGAVLADVAGGLTRGVSVVAESDLTLADLLIATPGENVVDTINNASTWDNLTLHSLGLPASDESVALASAGGTGSLTVRDCIFSGPGDKLTGTAPTGGIDVDYCAFATAGPDAIGAADDGVIAVTYGANIINNNPAYISYDATSADFLDVDNPAYSGAGSGASDLAGGGNYIGSLPIELSTFATE